MVNAFNVNDIEGGDEVSLSIYSDVVDDMFKCGQYNFRSGDAVDFDNLMVPCRELITVTLTESDGRTSDGHTVFVPCNANTEMTVDLIIPRGNLATIVDKQTSIERIMNFFKSFNPFAETKVGVQISTTIRELVIYTLKQSGLIENEALYNLKLEVIENSPL